MADVDHSRLYDGDIRPNYPHLLHQAKLFANPPRSSSCPADTRDLVQGLRINAKPQSARAASIGVFQAAAAAALKHTKQHMQQALPDSAQVLPSPSMSSSGEIKNVSVLFRELSTADPHSSEAGTAQTPKRAADADFKAAESDPKVAAGTIRPHYHKLQQSGGISVEQRCPPHGIKAICGRRPRMEDAFSAIPFLLELPVPPSIRQQSEIYPARMAGDASKPTAGSPGSESDLGALAAAAASVAKPLQHEPSSSAEHWSPYLETLHFFGVFDGHGGADAAVHCAQTLHQRIVEAVAAATGQGAHMAPDSEPEQQPGSTEPDNPVHQEGHKEEVPDSASQSEPAQASRHMQTFSASESDSLIQDGLEDHDALSADHKARPALRRARLSRPPAHAARLMQLSHVLQHAEPKP